jgi:cyclase
MLKKRLIFTLLYHSGLFMLSRNFRLQKVGNLKWLDCNYNFSQISHSIDELIVLDVSRGERSSEEFCATLRSISEGCFVPIAAGGGVRTIDSARRLLRSGADKVVVNSSLYQDDGFIHELASEFGQQCVVASIDIRCSAAGDFQAWSDCGTMCQPHGASFWVEKVTRSPIGELYLNSMDRDGTGQGYDMRLLDLLPADIVNPVIIAGGVGNASHLAAGLADARVDAVATANLFNFVGNGLKRARNEIVLGGVDLPIWEDELIRLNLKETNSKKRKGLYL